MAKSADAFRTISEVAEWLETPAHVLRFWESKFTQVKPVKRAGGRRYYRPADMQLIGGIKKLLHEDGMTIKGVQKILREQGVKEVAALSQPLDEVTEAEASEMAEDVTAAPVEDTTVLTFQNAEEVADDAPAEPQLALETPPQAELEPEPEIEPEQAADPEQATAIDPEAHPETQPPTDDEPEPAPTPEEAAEPEHELEPQPELGSAREQPVESETDPDLALEEEGEAPPVMFSHARATPEPASAPQEQSTPDESDTPALPSFLTARQDKRSPEATQTASPPPAALDVPRDPADDVAADPGVLGLLTATRRVSRETAKQLADVAARLKASGS